MRLQRCWLVTVLILSVGQLPVSAQEQMPVLTAPPADSPQSLQIAAPAAPTLLSREIQLPAPEPSLLHEEISAQLQFGFPAGVRLQLPLAGRANRYTVAEVFGGVEWTVLVATAGVRTIFEIP